MKIKNLPKKFEVIWEKCTPLLEQGRPGDLEHAKEVVEFILSYRGKLNMDLDVLIPLAMIHDIGHSAILPEHFEYITGLRKILNGKLVHMLAGAKIAKDLFLSILYDKNTTNEIVDIISIHDADQIKGMEIGQIFNTDNKKIFHDIDALDRYNYKRIKEFISNDEEKEKVFMMLGSMLDTFFYDEFRKIAEEGLDKMRNK